MRGVVLMFYRELRYSGFSFLNKAGTDPSDKPFVYFCCHPQDHDLYFHSISYEILRYQRDAVIWYLDGTVDEADEETFLSDLKKMQLFVLPVTSRFLKEENRARCIELKVALEYHIPILPLLQEKGLETLFNQTCGNFHCLCEQTNPPKLYEESIKAFLSSVLLDEQEINEIRGEFQTQLFLSYRKVDGKYIIDIMKAIHQFDFMRDVGIWYDAQITPGSDFNNSILREIDKSTGFVMLVTPNILDEDNYVMKIEYPYALKNNKSILPVEMIRTEDYALKEKYLEIPQCIPVNSTSEMYKELKKLTTLWNLPDLDETPIHLYRIGLAYLNGVGVEVDIQKAISLLTHAAKKQLPEAYRKLIFMYEHGEGVQQNYEKAIYWQRKLLEHIMEKGRRPLYKTQNYTKEETFELFLELRHLGDTFYSSEKYQESLLAYNQGLIIIFDWINTNSATSWSDEKQAKMYLSDVYLNIGYVYFELKQFDRVKEYYGQALAIDEELYNDDAWTGLDIRNLATTLFSFGQLYLMLNSIAEAEKSFYEAADLLIQLKRYKCWSLPNKQETHFSCGSTEELTDVCSTLERIYVYLAKLEIMKGHLGEAKDFYDGALAESFWLLCLDELNENFMAEFNSVVSSLVLLIKSLELQNNSTVDFEYILGKIEEIELFFADMAGTDLDIFTSISLEFYRTYTSGNMET